MADADQWEKDLNAALTQVVDGALVTKFIVIAETIDSESGNSQLEWFKSESMSIWDTFGLLKYCTAAHDARVIKAEDAE